MATDDAVPPLVITRTTPVDEMPQFFRVAEIGALGDVSNGVIYGLIKEGTLKAVTFGRVIRVPRSEVLRLLGIHENGNGARTK
jgi:excisionase family DNA binding protein